MNHQISNRSTKVKESYQIILTVLSFAIISLILLKDANPLFSEPGRDSGFFMYTGRELLRNRHLYTEIWDSKGPLIFWINSIGFLIGRDTRWGLFILEWLLLTTGALALYMGLSFKWSKTISYLATVTTFVALSRVFGNGNTIEEYNIIISSILILLFFKQIYSKRTTFLTMIMGSLTGLAFALRANNIGTGLVVCFSFLLWLWQNHKKDALKAFLHMIIGFLTTLLFVSLSFFLRGSFKELVDASILYNFSYSVQNNSSGILNSIIEASLFVGIGRFGVWGWVAIIGYVIALYRLYQIKNNCSDWVALATVLLFPTEIILSGISGRGFGHYFINWLPVMSILTAYFLDLAIDFVFSEKIKLFLSDQFLPWSQTLAIVVIISLGFNTLVYTHLRSVYRLVKYPQNGYQYVSPVAEYINTNSNPEDLVLVIGGQSGINIMSNRSSSDGALFFPLINDSKIGLEQQSRYIEFVRSQKPELVIDMSTVMYWKLPAVNPSVRENQELEDSLSNNYNLVLDYIWANYQLETETEGYLVYRLKGD